MRLFEECPYITPCGWCSRKSKPCEIEEKKKRKYIGVEAEKKEGVVKNE